MVSTLFDTNILIDYLNRVPGAKIELERFEQKAICLITWMAVMVGANPKTVAGTKAFLTSFEHLTGR